jgi:outer membrane protein assembly factor BamB
VESLAAGDPWQVGHTGCGPGWVPAAWARCSSGVALADGVVYAGCSGQTVYALNAGSGRQAWMYQTGGQVASGIAVASGIVYFGGGASLYAVAA